MLKLSRLQAGSLVMQLRDFELGSLLEDISDRFRLQAEDQRSPWDGRRTIALPIVHANPDRVEQVDYFAGQCLLYTIRWFDRPQVVWDDHTVAISVADTGIGIHPADVDAVFDRL